MTKTRNSAHSSAQQTHLNHAEDGTRRRHDDSHQLTRVPRAVPRFVTASAPAWCHAIGDRAVRHLSVVALRGRACRPTLGARLRGRHTGWLRSCVSLVDAISEGRYEIVGRSALRTPDDMCPAETQSLRTATPSVLPSPEARGRRRSPSVTREEPVALYLSLSYQMSVSVQNDHGYVRVGCVSRGLQARRAARCRAPRLPHPRKESGGFAVRYARQ